MRTSLIVSLIISVLLNVALFVMAYNNDITNKEWRSKYRDLEQKANEQVDRANQYAAEKFSLLEQLKKIETRTAKTNKILADTRKELDALSKKYSDQTKKLEISNQIANLPFSCPPLPKVKPKHKKRIPYDIAPSQQ